MLNARTWQAWVLTGLLVTAAAPMTASAQLGGPGGGGGGGGGANFGNQIQQAILSGIQQQAGFTDEEWAVVAPKVWNVLRLQVDSGAGGIGNLLGSMRGLGRGRGRGGGGGGGGGGGISAIISQIFSNGQTSLATTKRDELQSAIDNPNTTNSQLSAKMQEYRAAVQRVRVDLETAQADLVGVLTVRQEAALLQMGLLD